MSPFSLHRRSPCSDVLVCLSTYLLIQKIPAIVPNPATITAKSGQRQGDSPIRYVNRPTTDMTAKMEATNPYSMNNRRNPFTSRLPPLLSPHKGSGTTPARDGEVVLNCATFSPARPGRAKTRPFPSEGLLIRQLLQREQGDCSSLRASTEHCLIVRVLRARRTVCLLPRMILMPCAARAQGSSAFLWMKRTETQECEYEMMQSESFVIQRC